MRSLNYVASLTILRYQLGSFEDAWEVMGENHASAFTPIKVLEAAIDLNEVRPASLLDSRLAVIMVICFARFELHLDTS
jgi:hypothetical protein